GARVVRGPDWSSKKQDNGEGFLGTVIFVPKAGSSDNKVTIIWDSGRELRYRAGQDGKYDLRVFDTGPTGVIHHSIICDGCKENGIKGIRWKCTSRDDFDLCSKCYMSDAYDTSATFVRIDTEKSTAWAVPSREKSKDSKRKARGMFPGAEVMRGPHWKWKNDDGGEGEVGKIVEMKTWNKTGYRGGVKVRWKSDNTEKEYRIGGEGCVDVIYTRMAETASGGDYYADHLPLVDVVNPGIVALKPSDKVVVNLTLKNFKQLQDNDMYGGWDEDMKQCIDTVGTLVQMLFQGKTCRVQYDDGKTWSLNRAALTRKHTFAQGEAVTIMKDYNVVKDLQEGHGGWNDDMKSALGRNGRVVKIDGDGDIRVKVDDKTWIFSPVVVSPLDDKSVADEVPTLTEDDKKDVDSDFSSSTSSMNDVAEAIAQLFVDMLRGMPGQAAGTVSVVQAAGQGDLAQVQEILRKHPDKVNQKLEGKTALQLAAYEGHVEVIKFLLKSKADVNLTDAEGDTPLHYSAFGKEFKAMAALLDSNPNVNVVNRKKQTPLHIAVGKGCPKCTQLLIQKNCDPTIKDSDGDTAMHDCISQKEGQPDIMMSVLKSPKADYRSTNSKDFNVLQWAVLKDARLAVDIMLEGKKDFVNDRMSEGFSALHIACANGFVEVASSLVMKGNCDVNVRDKNQRTPLIIAVSQSHKRTIEALLQKPDIDVNAQDDKGNTALHVALARKDMQEEMQEDVARMVQAQGDDNLSTQIICSLVEARADVHRKNNVGNSPLDLATDQTTKTFMQLLSQKAMKMTLAVTKRGIMIPTHWEEMRGAQFKRVPLSKNEGQFIGMEYDQVTQRFQKTIPQAHIFGVQRVQNGYFWETYQLKKRQMEAKYGIGCSNELELFHGTRADLVDTICQDNLDFRLAGERVGALFGQGSYFAVEAKYSDLYCHPGKDRHKYMFIVKCLAGKCAQGDPKLKRPPPVDPHDISKGIYDCCVDNPSNPKIYCIFDNHQYYPEYIIEYM
ncbi:hypothetical protein FSP39_000330, partial [Pinctada imbricata]